MIRICRCSPGCCLPSVPEGVAFAGYSKPGARGLIHDRQLFVERCADDWQAGRHAFGVNVRRQDELRRGDVLRRLLELRHPHLLRLEAVCDCSIATEHLQGRVLNARQPTYVVGPGVGQADALDDIDDDALAGQLGGLAHAILMLHARGICHTDLTDHNVMSRTRRGPLVLIDLLGCVSASPALEALDRRLFHDQLLAPVMVRRPRLRWMIEGVSPLQALEAAAGRT